MLNDTYELVSEEHRKLVLNAVPSFLDGDDLVFEQCHVYADYNASLTDVLWNGSRPTEGCSRWVYDQSEMDATLITKVSLVMKVICG